MGRDTSKRHRANAERFLKEFRERLAKFGLELHAEKTRLMSHRHKLPTGYRVNKTAVLSGLHHEYSLVKGAA